jgi:hypothetical protein
MWIVLARFGCGVILHMKLQNELESGINHMKFALNHFYRFDSWVIAFLAGFLQAVSIFVIEYVNFVVILTSNNYTDIVQNFMSLAIVSEFDNAFYAALGPDPKKECIEDVEFRDLYRITLTSSRNACYENEKNFLNDDTVLKDEDGKPAAMMPKYIGVNYIVYGFTRRLLRCVYKIFRVLQISVWFYFLPFIALLGSYFVPAYLGWQ